MTGVSLEAEMPALAGVVSDTAIRTRTVDWTDSSHLSEVADLQNEALHRASLAGDGRLLLVAQALMDEVAALEARHPLQASTLRLLIGASMAQL
jgi:predicted DCC family thiol-disulfide oxidoreductase YuxK